VYVLALVALGEVRRDDVNHLRTLLPKNAKTHGTGEVTA
jgi:hypothetical protein